MLDLYQRAQWDAGEVFIRGKLLQLARGEQVASCRFLAERWGWTKDTVARFLKTMESEGNGNRANNATPAALSIRSEVRQGETVLILCNYEEWTLAGMMSCDTAAPGSEAQLATDGRQRRDKAKEGEEGEEERKEDAATTAPAPVPDESDGQSPSKNAERLISAYARPSFDRAALEAAADSLRRFAGRFTFEQILDGVAAVTAAVRDWPADERLAYLPTAANFFRDDLWRKHPDEWQSRRAARVRLASDRQQPAHTTAAPIDIGGRRIAGVLDTSAPTSTGYDPDIGF